MVRTRTGGIASAAVVKRGLAQAVTNPAADEGEPPQKKRAKTAACKTPTASERDTRPSVETPKAATTPASPVGFQATYDLILELRQDRTAVVDSMGSEAIASEASEADRAYQALVSLMLSSQTKDTINMATMKKLRAHEPGGLTVASVTQMPDETLHEYIRQVGFHNNKVRYIKATTRLLVEKHGGEVPRTMDELLELPGVGPKMAIILMRVAFDLTVGISVDTHVHRISNQLGWAGAGGTKTPEQTRKVLEAWMPVEIWPDVNLLLVGLGQEVQTEKPKLLRKALGCSDPARALRLLATLGVAVDKELAKNGLVAPR